MKHLSKLLPLATSACLVLLLILLAVHCIDIYCFRDAASTQIFTYEDSVARLKSLLPLIAVCTLLFFLALVFPSASKSNHPVRRIHGEHQQTYAKSIVRERPLLVIRTIILLIAFGFISWGVLNGGLYDVLVKAINICTECIGLG